MKITYLFLTLLFGNFIAESSFMTEQKKFNRVKAAIIEKQNIVESKLQEHNLSIDDFNLLFVAYKDCSELEVYAKKTSETTYKKIDTYKIKARSGKLGPKRMEGDFQTPEGFYYINTYNPNSQYHLSMGINYPNQSDRIKSNAPKLGGDIYIHGSHMTVGCLPMTDDKIKELYLYAIHAKNDGQDRIPVYIFPYKMNDVFFELYKKKYASSPELVDFWTNLKTGYDKFMTEKQELSYNIDANGNYNF
ncbi:L,D-transpeptidase family protein [Flavobacterium agrisoli]|uniref:L,D-transpeptidase family protein n=1 Tax=Flavobacterium agrisoli TaxID=2793066 RepID=A0A934UK26_9FLAO|nr:L,D-transpeptidase family protein [Flavobacterium agrisoli]MBK0370139.1 L,D-transpeptidase family protein [Flavobacterium agrisoli]